MLFNKAYKIRDLESGDERKTPDGGELFAMASCSEITKGPADLDRSFWMVASNEARDRDGDVIRAKGWNLKNFKKNPVGLFMHDYRELPVFRVPDTKIEGDTFKTLMHFPEDMGGLSDDVYRAYQAKMLNASSVGFGVEEVKEDAKTREEFGLPAENTYGNGTLFWKQELWELSAVTVPSNPEALAQIKSMEGAEKLKEMLQRSEDFVIVLDDAFDDVPEDVPDDNIDEDEELSVLATDIDTMKLTLEEAGYTVTETLETETLTVELEPEVEVELNLSPSPSIDEATMDAIALAIAGGMDAAFKQKKLDRIQRAVRRELNYQKGLYVED